MGGGYSHQTKGTPLALAAEIMKLKVLIDALRRSIANLGIQIDTVAKKLIIAAGRSLEVDGSLTVGGSATVSGTLDVTGNTIIGGTLSLPNGIIDNAALANPVSFANGNADLNSTNLTVAGSDLAVVTIAVPSGFTSAEVSCFSTLGNTRTAGAGAAPFYIQAWIQTSGAGSQVLGTDCMDGGSTSISAAWTAKLTGLSGSFQCGTWAAVDGTTGWASGKANAHTVVSATFLR